jgi:GH25 family lysozyme M1 (1,4-beta-N-acetylmuramidase)
MTQRKGIDVSYSNGVIDWDKVKADGIEFAMIRLGYGSDDPGQDDVQFERNVAECERLGIPWGPYLYSYALNVADAKSETAHVLRKLSGKSPELPFGFDMEDADGYKAKHGMPSNETLVDICYEVLLGVENAGYPVRLYASLSWLDNKLNSSKLDRFGKWVAQWNSKCDYAKPYDMWQYTSDGAVNGISGRVDMDYAYFDFGAPASQPAPAKSIDQLAQEVIAGQHGSGDARKAALGSQYDAVQARVNELLGTKQAPAKSIDQLAQEVIAGQHGSGEQRKRELGSQYDAVQARVNELLGAKRPAPVKSIHDLAMEVIRGMHGSGRERMHSLGANYNAVQAEVNRILSGR